MCIDWNHLRSAGACFVGIALLAGCASDHAMPKTASSADPLARQARRMRANEGDEQGTGLSNESRKIEKDLGYR